MQIAIDPNLYSTAQMYAERQGRNLNTVIEHYLEWFIRKEETAEQDFPDVVRSLLGAAEGQVDDTDINGRKIYYQHLEEKYQ